MNIEKIKVDEINVATYNPRMDLKPGDAEYEKIKQSIQTFGYIQPLIWNKRTKTLVSGHQRLKILIAEGYKEVEVVVVNLSLAKEKALNVAMNKISGSWDEQKLQSLMSELNQTPDINIGLTGFDFTEVSEILDGLVSNDEENFDLERELEKIKEPITKPGDVISLGKNILMCGDSHSKSDLEFLLKGQKVNLLFTDPPYAVSYAGQRPGNTKGKFDVIKNDNLPQKKYEAWLKQILQNTTGHLAPGASFYLWNGFKQFGPMIDMLIELNLNVACVITWVKEKFALSYSDYNPQTEFCLYGWKNKNKSHKWYGPTNESTLWEVERDKTAAYTHPNQKPTALAERALKNSTVRNDLVLDLFTGSGSTLLACEKLGRRCAGMEIDPKYCDVIVRRYAKHYQASKEVLEKYKEIL
ncbi:MAG: site-specific DNA-methyltransferase [Elusimicrobia bacterium]|nr:site-specific DNA-methyltransferase [Elusimicrobiota bacterium]